MSTVANHGLAVFLLLLHMAAQCAARGVLSIKLLHFQNRRGRTYEGHCCDPSPLDGATCHDQCDYVMRLIVSGLGRANDHVFLFHRPLKYDSNDLHFERDGGDLTLTILFDRWPSEGHVKMDVFLYDYDDFDHTTALVDWFETELVGEDADSKGQQQVVVNGNRQSEKTRLEFQWARHCYGEKGCLPPPPEWKLWPWEDTDPRHDPLETGHISNNRGQRVYYQKEYRKGSFVKSPYKPFSTAKHGPEMEGTEGAFTPVDLGRSIEDVTVVETSEKKNTVKLEDQKNKAFELDSRNSSVQSRPGWVQRGDGKSGKVTVQKSQGIPRSPFVPKGPGRDTQTTPERSRKEGGDQGKEVLQGPDQLREEDFQGDSTSQTKNTAATQEVTSMLRRTMSPPEFLKEKIRQRNKWLQQKSPNGGDSLTAEAIRPGYHIKPSPTARQFDWTASETQQKQDHTTSTLTEMERKNGMQQTFLEMKTEQETHSKKADKEGKKESSSPSGILVTWTRNDTETTSSSTTGLTTMTNDKRTESGETGLLWEESDASAGVDHFTPPLAATPVVSFSRKTRKPNESERNSDQEVSISPVTTRSAVPLFSATGVYVQSSSSSTYTSALASERPTVQYASLLKEEATGRTPVGVGDYSITDIHVSDVTSPQSHRVLNTSLSTQGVSKETREGLTSAVRVSSEGLKSLSAATVQRSPETNTEMQMTSTKTFSTMTLNKQRGWGPNEKNMFVTWIPDTPAAGWIPGENRPSGLPDEYVDEQLLRRNIPVSPFEMRSKVQTSGESEKGKDSFAVKEVFSSQQEPSLENDKRKQRLHVVSQPEQQSHQNEKGEKKTAKERWPNTGTSLEAINPLLLQKMREQGLQNDIKLALKTNHNDKEMPSNYIKNKPFNESIQRLESSDHISASTRPSSLKDAVESTQQPVDNSLKSSSGASSSSSISKSTKISTPSNNSSNRKKSNLESRDKQRGDSGREEYGKKEGRHPTVDSERHAFKELQLAPPNTTVKNEEQNLKLQSEVDKVRVLEASVLDKVLGQEQLREKKLSAYPDPVTVGNEQLTDSSLKTKSSLKFEVNPTPTHSLTVDVALKKDPEVDQVASAHAHSLSPVSTETFQIAADNPLHSTRSLHMTSSSSGLHSLVQTTRLDKSDQLKREGHKSLGSQIVRPTSPEVVHRETKLSLQNVLKRIENEKQRRKTGALLSRHDLMDLSTAADEKIDKTKFSVDDGRDVMSRKSAGLSLHAETRQPAQRTASETLASQAEEFSMNGQETHSDFSVVVSSHTEGQTKQPATSFGKDENHPTTSSPGNPQMSLTGSDLQLPQRTDTQGEHKESPTGFTTAGVNFKRKQTTRGSVSKQFPKPLASVTYSLGPFLDGSKYSAGTITLRRTEGRLSSLYTSRSNGTEVSSTLLSNKRGDSLQTVFAPVVETDKDEGVLASGQTDTNRDVMLGINDSSSATREHRVGGAISKQLEKPLQQPVRWQDVQRRVQDLLRNVSKGTNRKNVQADNLKLGKDAAEKEKVSSGSTAERLNFTNGEGGKSIDSTGSWNKDMKETHNLSQVSGGATFLSTRSVPHINSSAKPSSEVLTLPNLGHDAGKMPDLSNKQTSNDIETNTATHSFSKYPSPYLPSLSTTQLKSGNWKNENNSSTSMPRLSSIVHLPNTSYLSVLSSSSDVTSSGSTSTPGSQSLSSLTIVSNLTFSPISQSSPRVLTNSGSAQASDDAHPYTEPGTFIPAAAAATVRFSNINSAAAKAPFAFSSKTDIPVTRNNVKTIHIISSERFSSYPLFPQSASGASFDSNNGERSTRDYSNDVSSSGLIERELTPHIPVSAGQEKSEILELGQQKETELLARGLSNNLDGATLVEKRTSAVFSGESSSKKVTATTLSQRMLNQTTALFLEDKVFLEDANNSSSDYSTEQLRFTVPVNNSHKRVSGNEQAVTNIYKFMNSSENNIFKAPEYFITTQIDSVNSTSNSTTGNINSTKDNVNAIHDNRKDERATSGTKTTEESTTSISDSTLSFLGNKTLFTPARHDVQGENSSLKNSSEGVLGQLPATYSNSTEPIDSASGSLPAAVESSRLVTISSSSASGPLLASTGTKNDFIGRTSMAGHSVNITASHAPTTTLSTSGGWSVSRERIPAASLPSEPLSATTSLSEAVNDTMAVTSPGSTDIRVLADGASIVDQGRTPPTGLNYGRAADVRGRELVNFTGSKETTISDESDAVEANATKEQHHAIVVNLSATATSLGISDITSVLNNTASETAAGVGLSSTNTSGDGSSGIEKTTNATDAHAHAGSNFSVTLIAASPRKTEATVERDYSRSRNSLSPGTEVVVPNATESSRTEEPGRNRSDHSSRLEISTPLTTLVPTTPQKLMLTIPGWLTIESLMSRKPSDTTRVSKMPTSSSSAPTSIIPPTVFKKAATNMQKKMITTMPRTTRTARTTKTTAPSAPSSSTGRTTQPLPDKQDARVVTPSKVVPILAVLLNGSEPGPKVIVPSRGLFVPGSSVHSNVTEEMTSPQEMTQVSGTGARHVNMRSSSLSVQTVFSRYWPAILGLTVGTLFLVAALMTSLACRQQRLFVQRRQWIDTPQHLTTPPDASEYTSSASSLTSDNTRSPANFT